MSSSVGEEIAVLLVDVGFLLSRVNIRGHGEGKRENLLIPTEVGYRKMGVPWASESRGNVWENIVRGEKRWRTSNEGMADGLTVGRNTYTVSGFQCVFLHCNFVIQYILVSSAA